MKLFDTDIDVDVREDIRTLDIVVTSAVRLGDDLQRRVKNYFAPGQVTFTEPSQKRSAKRMRPTTRQALCAAGHL